MSNVSALVGERVTWTATVRDSASAAVDPSAFTFYVKPPSGSGVAAESHAWDGASWTSSVGAIGVPARLAVGTFRLTLDIPHANTSQGLWGLGWKSVENGSGEGEDADDAAVVVRASVGI